MRSLTCALWLLVSIVAGGCSVCCTPYDETYGAEGGRWLRQDLCHGRVASAFADAGYQADSIEADLLMEGEADLPLLPEDEQP